MTTLIEGGMERLRVAEDAEAAVYRAALTWAPSGEKAAEAGAKLALVGRQAQAAEIAFNDARRAVEQVDPQAAGDLVRLHNVGQLTREAVGEGGGKLVSDFLTASSALRKAREADEAAKRTSSEAHSKSATAWRDVLRAFDSFRQRASEGSSRGLAALFGSGDSLSIALAPPNNNAAALADACKGRLAELGAKA